MEQYELMGNTLALQYGGSDAHSVFFQRQKGEWEASTRGKVRVLCRYVRAGAAAAHICWS
eukprot:1161171-Pelagomonas_calceolata.AAC.7